ncbi:MAG TPA: hypothetical protein VGE40_11345, partial [Bacilli bacterium]
MRNSFVKSLCLFMMFTLIISSMPILGGGMNTAQAAVKTIGTFENKMVDEWLAGSNVTSIYSVTSIANGGGTGGGGVLEASTASVAGTTLRTIYKNYGTSQDWTATPMITAYFNSYGGAPGAAHYYAKIVAYSGTNSTNSVTEVFPDGWNQISLDLNSWAYKNSVTKVEISFYNDSATAWNGSFQIDRVKLYDNSFLNIVGDFERSSGLDGWVAGSYTNSIARVSSMANGPGKSYRGQFVLEGTTATVPGNVKRSMSRIFGTNQDWTATPVITAYLNGYGGAPNASNYWAEIKVWSGTQSTAYSRKVSPDAWNLLKIDIGGWAYKNAVSRLDISFWADTASDWNPKFQIDDISRGANNFPVFTSSNSTYTDAVNSMFFLHWNEAVGPNPATGDNQTDWREWDSLATTWLDTKLNLARSLDYNQTLKDNLLTIEMDNDGYVFMYEQDNGYKFKDGWPFPTYEHSGGITTGWEFDDGTANGFSGFNVANQTFVNKAWNFDTTVSDPYVMKSGLNINAYNSPFVVVRMKSNNTNTTGAVYFTTSASTGLSESKKVTFTVINDNEYHNYYIPVYKNAYWTGTVTTIRLDPVETGNTGGKVSVDFINCAYDNRHMVTNSVFILGSTRFFLWNQQDVSFLQSNMTRLRKAMNYVQTELRGNTYSYIWPTWWGHDGTSGISPTVRKGYGIGGNYWDLLPFGGKDAYATIYYYAALQAMSTLEALVAANPGWNIGSNPYGETASSFSTKAASVKTAYNNTFWDTTKRRYIGNIDIDGVKHDYGFVFLNLEAVHYGLSDTTKTADIYSWLNGTRTIGDDTSTGTDIYSAFTFAPRATTKRNLEWYTFVWTDPGAYPFGGQVQDGGAILYTSYYDVMARIKYNGISDGWTRLKAILNWYNATQSEGGYRRYYANRGITMQGGGTAGGIGIDAEFTESTLVPLTFLYGVMGIDADADGLRFAPKMPSDFTWYQVDKAKYSGNAF